MNFLCRKNTIPKIKTLMIALFLILLSGFAFAQMQPPVQPSNAANVQQSQQRQFELMKNQLQQGGGDMQALGATLGSLQTKQELGVQSLQNSQQTSEQLKNNFFIQNNANPSIDTFNNQQQQQFEKQKEQQLMQENLRAQHEERLLKQKLDQQNMLRRMQIK